MRVRILAVGKARPDWVREASASYLSRLKHYGRFELVEVRASKIRNGHARDAAGKEGERLLAALEPRERLIALDERGRAVSSEELARRLEEWQLEGRPVALAIGGAQGLDRSVLDRSEARLSLSRLTLPHQLARVVLAEQLYRACSMLRGEPYHNP